MNKLTVVYNICGISGRESLQYWKTVIHSIISSKTDDVKVAISACYVNRGLLDNLKSTFPEILIVAIEQVVPVNVSFNVTVQKAVEHFGPSEGYLYLDYGIVLQSDTLDKIYTAFKSGPYSMVSTRTDNDNGYHLWYGVGKFHGDESENDKLFVDGDFIVPVGKCVNLHAQIFSHELYEAYGNKLMPDIFAAYCTESVFSFMNAAIKRKWLITKDIILHHEQLAYNAASGFGNGFNGLDRMYLDPRPVIEHITPGIPFGMGYDESRRLVMHDVTQYDMDGFCTNDNLKKYIKEHLFLSKDFLDYEKLAICMI